MPRLDITKLPPPRSRRYRADPLLVGDDGRIWFETKAQARKEDQKRVTLLRTSAENTLAPDEREALQRLAHRLERPANASRIPMTLASSRYLRQHRRRFILAATRLITATRERVTTVTLIPRAWELSAGDLALADPRALLERLRLGLHRAGADQASGFFIGFIDGEYEPNRAVYVLHVHAIVSGEMIKVVERLRQTRAFRSTDKNYVESGETVRFRVRFARKPLTNVPYVVGYQLKSYWLAHAATLGPSGWLVRNGKGERLPLAQHSEVLLWQNRWTLGDISLLVHVRVGRNGFERTARSA